MEQGSLTSNSCLYSLKQDCFLQLKLSIKGAGHVPVVEHLPGMCQAVGLILASTALKKKKKACIDNECLELGLLAHACNLCIPVAEARGQPRLYRGTLSQKHKIKIKTKHRTYWCH